MLEVFDRLPLIEPVAARSKDKFYHCAIEPLVREPYSCATTAAWPYQSLLVYVLQLGIFRGKKKGKALALSGAQTGDFRY